MMLLLSIIALITLLIAQAARAAPSNLTPRTVGEYKIVPMKWIGQVHPGGPNITLEGDMKDIINQIKVMNPAFEFPKPSEEELRTRDLDLLARDQRVGPQDYPTFTLCNRREFRNADIRAIEDGEKYLFNVPGLCSLPPARGYCSRVSCSWDSGIYFCNDADHAQYIYCREIWLYSQLARNTCGAIRDNLVSNGKFNSQRFRTDTGYSVLDAWGDC